MRNRGLHYVTNLCIPDPAALLRLSSQIWQQKGQQSYTVINNTFTDPLLRTEAHMLPGTRSTFGIEGYSYLRNAVIRLH